MYVWACDNVAQAQRRAVRCLRQGRNRRVEIHRGAHMIWCRGVAKMPHQKSATW
jgi:hypothetical protein